MRNISYFCIVKHLNIFFRGFFLLIFAIIVTLTYAKERNDSLQQAMNQVEISLITCGPGEEVWSLYGHTAIRITNLTTGEDIVVNYGMFSFKQPYFIPRFIFGRTDYQMGIESFDDFITEYSQEGRYVIQQPLAISPEGKWNILRAIATNYLPQNRTYRYNFFYDNCTTRARDMLTDNCIGIVSYPTSAGHGQSYRTLIHKMNSAHLWARFGNDLLLGCQADKICTQEESQFLPLFLMADMQNAIIKESGTGAHRLTKSTYFLLPPQGMDKASKVIFSELIKLSAQSLDKTKINSSTSIQKELLSPKAVFTLLLFVTVLLAIYERKSNRYVWLFDTVLYAVTGIAGLLLLFMIFSKHPTVQVNWQILTLNPLWLVFLCPMIRSIKNKDIYHYRRWAILMAVLIIMSVLLSLAFYQKFAEGIYILALILLIRLSTPLLIKKT